MNSRIRDAWPGRWRPAQPTAPVALDAAAQFREAIGPVIEIHATPSLLRAEKPLPRALMFERDEAAVRVVTIQKSKGLEYNIVFCPFSWGKAEPKGALLFHDKEDGALTLDLGSEETAEHEQIARCENLAEQLRLLYVALTRAKLETHFAWGRFNGCEVSAANWLLHGQSTDDGDPVGALLSRMKSLTDDEWQHELATLGLDAPDSIAVVDLPGRDGPQYRFAGEPDVSLKARAFCGAIERDWRITSFTALTAGHEAEQPEFDRGEAPARPETAATGIHAFARGMKAGVCLHEVFEELDFQNDAAVEELVGRKLASFGVEAPESLTAVAATVRRTLSAPLAPGLTLRQIARAARLDELEFFFPFGPLQADELGAILGTASIPILPMHFERQRGFIKGFIDLIFQHDGRFYIVDWKSNWLGSDADAYNSENLRAEMTRHHYGLQYHLYVLALHRYLALRLPDYDYARDFGGVFYLFIRGLEAAERGHGIFHDRPRLELIESLDALFSQEEAR